jgi:hypothetical protein
MGAVGRVCVCIGVSGALVLSLCLVSSSASAQSALLDAISSQVTLAHAGGVARQVTLEQIIRSGDTVATDETGRAAVTYPDGSTALLEENSALTIEFVQTSAGDYVVRMQQTLGRVWYAVTRAVALGSRYEVRSAAMASVIRAGSDSYVSVSPTGETTIVTINGTVDASAGGVDVSVPAGSSTTVTSVGMTSSVHIPAPTTPAPASIARSRSTPTRTPAPSPTTPVVPGVATLPTSAATKKAQASGLPVVTPKPVAAPTPAPTTPKEKDKLDPRKEAPGQPSPETSAALH